MNSIVGFSIAACYIGWRLRQRATKCVPFNQTNSYFLGVDVGGTTVSLGIVDARGKLHSACSEDVKDKTPQGVVNLICSLFTQALTHSKNINRNQVVAVGLGVPGIIDTTSGVVKACANYSWENVSIAEILSEALGKIPVVLENDANVAMLGERWVGSAKGTDHSVMLTLGTGIGGAVVASGILLRGSTGSAGEFGHMIAVPNGRISVSTGVCGVLEDYTGARALATHASEVRGSPITAELAMRLAKTGESDMEECVDEVAMYLAIACVNVERILDPQVIVLTGGLTLAGDYFLAKVLKYFEDLNWSLNPHTSQIVLAATGNQAGIIGAGYCAYAYHNGISV